MTARILIAEDNDISREMMAAALTTRGYKVAHASDGQSAIDVMKKQNIDLALVDINMAPTGGFKFVEHIVSQGIDLPIIIVTADNSSDILIKASNLGVMQLLQKPIDPNRLVAMVGRILERRGKGPLRIVTHTHETTHSPESLMQKAIDLASDNVKNGNGRPFGAVVADKDGKILGKGVNGISSRIDPAAHAEVMAIRQAAEKLKTSDLSQCSLYCSSEPTMMGRALIISAGIQKVYFGLSHEEIRNSQAEEEKVRKEIKHFTPFETQYEQICHDEAMEMYLQALRDEH